MKKNKATQAKGHIEREATAADNEFFRATSFRRLKWQPLRANENKMTDYTPKDGGNPESEGEDIQKDIAGLEKEIEVCRNLLRHLSHARGIETQKRMSALQEQKQELEFKRLGLDNRWVAKMYLDGEVTKDKKAFGVGAERLVYNLLLKYYEGEGPEKKGKGKRPKRQKKEMVTETLVAKEGRFDVDQTSQFLFHKQVL